MIIPQAQAAQNRYTQAADQSFADYGRLMGDYQDWAKTGGYSAQDIGNIRARSVAPVRAAYADANRGVDRQRSLQGGYSPGYGTLKSRLAREQSSSMSDATTNAEAQIAQLINSGKQFGMQGQSSLFSATPGMASTYGNFSNQAMDNWLQSQGLQNQLSLGIMGAQNQASQIPGKWQQGFDNAMKLGNTAANVFSTY